MSDESEPEPTDPMDDGNGVPLCTGCGRPYKRDQYYCTHCGAGVGNRTPYVPYVNIPFNYIPMGHAVRNLWRGEERRWWAVILSFFIVVACMPYLLLAAPFVLVGWLRNRKKKHRETATGEAGNDAGPDADSSDELHTDGGLA